MKIVAFMQNMWLRDPARFHRVMAASSNPERFRRLSIERFLFAGCLTGRRLRAALGELCDHIVWEEASREVTATANAKVRADLAHIGAVISIEKPDLIITFGRIATDAVSSNFGIKIIPSPHPAARNQLDQARFAEAMLLVNKTVLNA